MTTGTEVSRGSAKINRIETDKLEPLRQYGTEWTDNASESDIENTSETQQPESSNLFDYFVPYQSTPQMFTSKTF